jgi:hypothetical protein
MRAGGEEVVPKTTESSTCTHSRAARTDATCTDRTKKAMAMASVQDVKAIFTSACPKHTR